MEWSLKLFAVRGISVRVHLSFLLVLAWAAYLGVSDAQAPVSAAHGVGFMLIFVLLLFCCVLLHELGHALVAQLFGVTVQDITLWPIGGVARMAKLPEQPYQEFLISAAGPATNILVALGLTAAAVVWVGPVALLQTLASPLALNVLLARMDGSSLLLLLAANNILLALFNLLPAFPMDGGRLLRALLAVAVPFSRATRWAALVGQGLALAMLVAALAAGSWGLMLVAFFVFFAARQERRQAASSAAPRGWQVGQVMQPVGRQLHPLQTLRDAALQGIAAPQSASLVVEAGRLVGLLAQEDLLAGLRRRGDDARVGSQMSRDALRLSPADALVDAQARLTQRHAWAAIVVDHDRVVGILAQSDLVRLAELLDASPTALLQPPIHPA